MITKIFTVLVFVVAYCPLSFCDGGRVFSGPKATASMSNPSKPFLVRKVDIDEGSSRFLGGDNKRKGTILSELQRILEQSGAKFVSEGGAVIFAIVQEGLVNYDGAPRYRFRISQANVTYGDISRSLQPHECSQPADEQHEGENARKVVFYELAKEAKAFIISQP